ncbi:MAG TPA: polysaccharide deacetylase family protein [Ferruginibacter sp.]|nr:polysaccharide deacetylase family protein [Ferruginibacter sp.]
MFSSGNTIVKLRNRLGGLSRDAGWHLGLNQSFIKNARGARILVYHGICQDNHLQYNTLFVKLKAFESQLLLYKKYFNLVSLDDYYHRRVKDNRFNICLTFDDGYANNYKYILPLLEQYQVPATFFVTGIRDAGYDILWNDVLSMAYKHGPGKISFRKEAFIKRKNTGYISSLTGKRLDELLRFTEFDAKAEMIELLGSFKHKAQNDYWLQMTPEEIKLLSASKWVTIGNHSYYHNDLGKISAASVREDITRSKQLLEKITGKEIRALAFPYGSYSAEAVNEAKHAGYSQLLATKFLFPADVRDTTLRERLTINPFISNINQMHANISGNYK